MIDLQYKNKEGISLQSVIDLLSSKTSKKELISKLKAKKSIDTLLTKLINGGLIEKIKEGRSVLFIKADSDVVEMSNEAEIKKLTPEINQDDLDHLKEELEKKSGKKITTVLHTRNEKKPKKKHTNADKLYEENKDIEHEVELENPYRFVLNFFTTVLNGEKATIHFKRRDSYVVKSIYNKFKTLCEISDKYDTEQQHVPFYRAFTIDEDSMMVKMYHIDMNHVIRGYHNIFKISEEDKKYIFGAKDEH